MFGRIPDTAPDPEPETQESVEPKIIPLEDVSILSIHGVTGFPPVLKSP